MKKTTNIKTMGRFIAPATLALGLLVGNSVMGQTNATMNTTIVGTTYGGQEALSIKQYGTGITSGGNKVFTFSELLSVEAPSFNKTGWSLQQVIVRLRLDAYDQSLILTNNGASDFVSSDLNTAVLSYNWATFTITTRTFDPDKESSIASSNFPTPVLALPNGVTIASGGAVYSLSPENPVQTTSIVNNVSRHSTTGYSDYDGTGTFDWTFFTNPTFSSSGSGQNLVSTSDSGSYQMFAEVEYIVIPEPGTMAMMAIALGSAGGLALIRRRKR